MEAVSNPAWHPIAELLPIDVLRKLHIVTAGFVLIHPKG
jgi:hypothetical protein